MTAMRAIKGLFDFAQSAARELSDIERLFSDEFRNARKLVFYSESAIYFRYYEDYIEHILQNSQMDLCYISSDANDPIFKFSNPQLKPFYIKNSLAAAFA